MLPIDANTVSKVMVSEEKSNFPSYNISSSFVQPKSIIMPIKTANKCGQRCQMHILHAEYPRTYSKKNALHNIAIEPKVAIPTSR